MTAATTAAATGSSRWSRSSRSTSTGTIPATGSSTTSIVVWGILLLVFGRMAILFGRKPKVISANR
jgi:LPXTG-motif cell wall-anchored protein